MSEICSAICIPITQISWFRIQLIFTLTKIAVVCLISQTSWTVQCNSPVVESTRKISGAGPEERVTNNSSEYRGIALYLYEMKGELWKHRY